MSVHKVIDKTDVLLAFISSALLGSIQAYLGVIALVLTIFYTIWKWSFEIYDRFFTKPAVRRRRNRIYGHNKYRPFSAFTSKAKS